MHCSNWTGSLPEWNFCPLATKISGHASMKKIAMGGAALLSGLFLLALPVILVFGLTRVSVIVWPWLAPAFFWTLGVSVFILGPLGVIRRTRGFSAAGLMIASYVFGAWLWITSLLLTWALWGGIAVFIGLLVLGIGIVQVALLAALFRAQWWNLLDLVMLIVATFGTRLLAVWLAEKVAADQYARVASPSVGRRPRWQRSWLVLLSVSGVLAVLMFIFGRWPNPNENLSATQVFSQSAGSVVRIEISREDRSEITGSGFVALLGQHPCIVTNKHVVENADRVKVGIQENLLFDVPNYRLAKDLDLAVLDLPAELQLKALPLRTAPVQVGEIVYAIGFPMGLPKSITQGVITANQGAALQFDAPISSGSSGGPVLDGHGKVVGVATMGSIPGTEAIVQNMNFAISVAAFPPLASFQLPRPTSIQVPSTSPLAEPTVKRAELVNPQASSTVKRAEPVNPQPYPTRQPTNRDLMESERLLNAAYNDFRRSLSPKDRDALKLQQREWFRERDKVRNNRSEYLRMTEERTQELRHMLAPGEH
jgi:uncharacterized protein YecT (DUF1311 family)